jgi:hypothetical protein
LPRLFPQSHKLRISYIIVIHRSTTDTIHGTVHTSLPLTSTEAHSTPWSSAELPTVQRDSFLASSLATSTVARLSTSQARCLSSPESLSQSQRCRRHISVTSYLHESQVLRPLWEINDPISGQEQRPPQPHLARLTDLEDKRFALNIYIWSNKLPNYASRCPLRVRATSLLTPTHILPSPHD